MSTKSGPAQEVASIIEFSGDSDPKYMWTENCNLRAESFDAIQHAALDVGRDQLLAFQEDPRGPALAKELLAKGLVLRVEEEARGQRRLGDNEIKFFCLVEVPGGYDRDEVVNKVCETVVRAGIEKVSVYSGSGFADVLVKGHANCIYAIGHAVRAILAAFPGVRIDSKTYIVAQQLLDESDDVDLTYPGNEPLLRELDVILQIDPSDLERLPSEARHTFEAKFNQLLADRVFLEYEDEPVVRSLFVSLARSDQRRLTRDLYFLVEIESSLRDLAPRFLAEITGDSQWRKNVLPSIAKAVDIDPDADWQDYGFEDLIAVLGKADQGKHRLQSKLGRDWERTLRTAVTWRNRFAHGKLAGVLEQGTWIELVDLVVNLLPIKRALDQLSRAPSRQNRRSGE